MTVTLISQFSPNSASGVIPHKKVWERSKRGKEKMKTTLLIMAAGIGSRFGTGIKQLSKVDSNSHIIMDYSIHDAIEAGFNKIIFIIRRDIEEEFKSVIGDRIEKTCAENNVEVDYAYQSLSSIVQNKHSGVDKHSGVGIVQQ